MAVNILPRSCTHKKSLKWIFIVGVIYLVLIWFGYKSLEKNISQMHRSGHSFHPRLKKVSVYIVYLGVQKEVFHLSLICHENLNDSFLFFKFTLL